MESAPALHLLTHTVITNGLLVSLAAVCLLHYILTIHRRKEAEQELQQTLKRVQFYKYELDGLHLTHQLAQLQNELLGEILAAPDITAYIDSLFEKIVEDPKKGICALYSINGDKQVVLNYRGERCSFKSEGVPRDLLEQMSGEHTLKLANADLEQSGLLKYINMDARPHIKSLFIFTTPEINEVRYLWLTSELYPANVENTQQIEFARRLIRGVDIRLRQQDQLQEHLDQLQFTQVKLEMQNLIGDNLQGFIQKLIEITKTDRCVLYLSENDKGELRKSPLLKVDRGTSINPTLDHKRATSELYLATLAKMSNRDFINLNRESLEKVTTTDSIRQALILSLRGVDGQLLSIACLTRESSEAYDKQQLELVQWASPLIANAVCKTLTEAIVRRKATLDGLTKLANRRTFDERISQELYLAKSQRKTCSLVLIDLDHFKQINDRFGHQTGDTVLKETARILQRMTSQTRTTDPILVARYGGEEMAVLLPGVAANGAMRIAESILRERELIPGVADEGEFKITMSAGIASYPENASDVEGLIKSADEALYEAKRNGRNRAMLSKAVYLVGGLDAASGEREAGPRHTLAEMVSTATQHG
ncbi:MAG: hypothetical protein CMJ46_08140 [Planctomyces sp.]|nr:hypothetical protein [Planctomyces sp.]